MNISRHGEWATPAQVVRVETNGTVELFVSAKPARDEGGFVQQARSMYRNLQAVLQTQGAASSNVITEKVFFSDVDRQFHDLKDIRQEYYNSDTHTPHHAPATIFLHQPPIHPGRMCELQAYAILPRSGVDVRVRSVEDMPGLASGTVVEHGGFRHIHLMNLTGGQGPGNGLGFPEQAEDMFLRAECCLRRDRFSFGNVVRTWIYVNDIDQDYATLNQVRRRFYRQRGVMPLPASTGIQGSTYPVERGCTMDLYAVSGKPSPKVEVMHASAMNEATRYGSWFSRGIKLSLEQREVLFVSGTASIDTEGKVVHPGEIEGQIHRMIFNVEDLLSAHGASMADAVTAITYLKHPGYLDAFHKVSRERSITPSFPNNITVADVCRPEWLCEMEVTAVRPCP